MSLTKWSVLTVLTFDRAHKQSHYGTQGRKRIFYRRCTFLFFLILNNSYWSWRLPVALISWGTFFSTSPQKVFWLLIYQKCYTVLIYVAKGLNNALEDKIDQSLILLLYCPSHSTELTYPLVSFGRILLKKNTLFLPTPSALCPISLADRALRKWVAEVLCTRQGLALLAL